MQVALAIVVWATSAVLWVSNLLGVPGNWLMLAVVGVYAFFTETSARWDVGWPVMAGMLFLAALGELVEFLAGAWGTSKAGGSRRAAVLAMGGSLIGALVGMFAGVGVPIPVVGSVIGALLCASLGALGGAVLGERWKGRDLDASMRVGHAAFWGRLFGTVGKIVAGVVMLALLTLGLLL